jgi:holliday junction DNA helicase RuvB
MTEILPGMYPDDWDGYIGQDQIKLQLRVAAASSRARGGPMRPFLLSGGAGFGKTALAVLTAQELGTNVLVSSGKITADQALVILPQMEDGDVWVLEEIHTLAKDPGWLLHFLENGILVGPFGKAVVPAVNVIATTTRPDAFGEDILQRFKHLKLQPYSDDEGGLIALSFSEKLLVPHGLPDLDGEVAMLVAGAARRHPRTIRDLLIDMRDLLLTGGVQDYAGALQLVLSWQGITTDGMHAAEVAYLTALADRFMGRPVGEKLVMDQLGLTKAELAATERELLTRGFISREKDGRRLTPAGATRVAQLKKAAA